MKRRDNKAQPCRSPTLTWNDFDSSPFTQTQTSSRLKNDLMARNNWPFTRTQTSGQQWNDLMSRYNWPSTPYSGKTFQSLSQETRSYAFSRSTKHAKNSLLYSQDLSKICFRVKIWSVVLHPYENRSNHHPVFIPPFFGVSFQDI